MNLAMERVYSFVARRYEAVEKGERVVKGVLLEGCVAPLLVARPIDPTWRRLLKLLPPSCCLLLGRYAGLGPISSSCTLSMCRRLCKRLQTPRFFDLVCYLAQYPTYIVAYFTFRPNSRSPARVFQVLLFPISTYKLRKILACWLDYLVKFQINYARSDFDASPM